MGSGFAVFGVAVFVVSVSLKRSEKEQQKKVIHRKEVSKVSRTRVVCIV
jgi:hypothetical protein